MQFFLAMYAKCSYVLNGVVFHYWLLTMSRLLYDYIVYPNCFRDRLGNAKFGFRHFKKFAQENILKLV